MPKQFPVSDAEPVSKKNNEEPTIGNNQTDRSDSTVRGDISFSSQTLTKLALTASLNSNCSSTSVNSNSTTSVNSNSTSTYVNSNSTTSLNSNSTSTSLNSNSTSTSVNSNSTSTTLNSNSTSTSVNSNNTSINFTSVNSTSSSTSVNSTRSSSIGISSSNANRIEFCNIGEHSTFQNEIAQLHEKVVDLEYKNQNLEKSIKEYQLFNKNLIEKFKNFLSVRQINAIGYNCKIFRYDSPEIISALQLRYNSPRTYKILQNQLPLPSDSTLQRWVNKIECSAGFQDMVLEILKQKAQKFEIMEKLCVLSFDEIEISKKICYNPSTDQILGPISKCQVVLLRGLCSNWKQPIDFGFDLSFNKESFLEILQKIQNCDLIPIASVCDFSPSNRGLLKELNISSESPIFNDKKLKHPIFFFADFPHMLKLLRNHVLDQGIFLKSGYYLSKSLFQNILKIDNKELKLCHKISNFHLVVRGTERQNVRKAAQLFSNTVGNFVLEYLPREIDAGKFILLIDSVFDLFNSFKEFDGKKPSKNAFSFNPDQVSLLTTALSEIQNVRVATNNPNILKSRKSLLPFQLGLIQSINALMKLYQYINTTFEIRYILTYKLTQDALEIFFCQIRILGHGYTNPTPIEFMHRFRILIFCKNYSSIRFSKNFEREKIEENYITYEIGHINRIYNSNLPPNVPGILGNIQMNSLYYLAGFVSFKCKNFSNCKYSFGGFSHSNDRTSPFSTWISRITKGHLSLPSEIFWNQVQKMEVDFQETYSNQKTSGIRSLISLISSHFPDIPSKLIRSFVRTRFFIKLRFQNSSHSKKGQSRKLQKFLS